MALAAGGGGMLTFGWDAGVLGGVLLTKEFQTDMGMPSTNTIAMIASVFLLASWLGCILMAIFGMVLGRRQNILLGNLISAIGTIISASSYGPGQMMVSRVIISIGKATTIKGISAEAISSESSTAATSSKFAESTFAAEANSAD